MENLAENWYLTLLEDCKGIVTEAIFSHRWALVEGYWNLGKRIREDEGVQKFDHGTGKVLQDLAKDLKISRRTIYLALAAFDKYPDLGTIPEGKNISWNKLVTKYLPKDTKEKPVSDRPHLMDCHICGGWYMIEGKQCPTAGKCIE